MKKREDIIQKFSTFLNFTQANSITSVLWLVDVELERDIKKIKQSDPEAKEEFWAIHFLKSCLRTSRVQENESLASNFHSKNGKSVNLSVDDGKAERYLSAYLQEPCLWAAYKVHKKFNYIRYKYPLEECFQIACMGANPPSYLLKSFNLNYSFSSISNYAKTALIHFIQNTIYHQDIEVKNIKYTDYGLLKDLTKIELKTALLLQGVSQKNTDLYCIAWKCFDEVYSANKHQGSRSLKAPNQEQITEICSYYNMRLQQLDIAFAPVIEEEVQEILSTCIQAAKRYRTKRFIPLDNHEYISEVQSNNLDNIVQEETWEQVLSVISQIFLAMPEAGQLIIKLSKGLNLTQTEVADVLKDKYSDLRKQYQVARQLAKYNRNFLKDFLTQWQLLEPEVQINNERDIEKIKEALNECLELYTKKILDVFLEVVFNELINENKINHANHHINLTINEKQKLIKRFIQKLEANMCLPNKSLETIEYKIDLFVDEWLRTKNFIVNN